MAHQRLLETSDPIIDVPSGVSLKVNPSLRLKNSQRSRIIEARRERVACLAMQNKTEAQIADELDCSPALVHYDLAEIRQQWRERTVDQVAEAAILDLARLDYIIANNLERAAVDYKSASIVCEAIGQRAQILGYRNGMTWDVADYIRKLAEERGFDPEIAISVAQRVSVTLK